MKLLPVLCLLLIMVVGCGRFGAGSNSTNTSNDEPKSPKIAKILDMPSLLGKSPDEISKIVGQSPGTQDKSVAFFDLPDGALQVGYDKGKQTIISFDSKVKNESSLKFPGFRFPEELGQAVGIDVKGEPLTIGSDSEYKDFDINGKKCDLKITKLEGSYQKLSLYCP